MSAFSSIFQNADKLCGGLFMRGMNGGLTENERREYMERYADQEEKILGKPLFEMTEDEAESYKCLTFNSGWGKLEGRTCPVCRNKGFMLVRDGKYTVSRDCECMKWRNVEGAMKRSEGYDLMARCTFENFTLAHTWQRELISRVKAWTRQKEYPFLYLGGKTGTGKTHLAVAALSLMMRKGGDVGFMSWRADSRDLKMGMTEFPVYRAKLERFKRAAVLMIDDFLWSPHGGVPTDEDLRLAKEIVDVRTARGLRTIVTANYTVRGLCELTEEVGGRINYAAGGSKNFAVTIGESAENYRMGALPMVEEIREGDYDPFAA